MLGRHIKILLISGFLSLANTAGATSKGTEICGAKSDVYTVNREKLDLAIFSGLHVSIGRHSDICQIEAVEGLVWWRDGSLTAIQPADTTNWVPFKVAFGFRMVPGFNKESESPRGSLRTPNWNGLTLDLTRYPGLQIRLGQQNRMDQPAGFRGNFIMEDFNGHDGRRKLIHCSIVATSISSEKGKNVRNLTALELSNRNFEQDYDLCEMDLLDFSLENGEGRISFSIEFLKDAPKAIPAIFDYIRKATLEKGV